MSVSSVGGRAGVAASAAAVAATPRFSPRPACFLERERGRPERNAACPDGGVGGPADQDRGGGLRGAQPVVRA
jgi:hypothetical protein